MLIITKQKKALFALNGQTMLFYCVLMLSKLAADYSGNIVTVMWLPALLNSFMKLQMSWAVRASRVLA